MSDEALIEDIATDSQPQETSTETSNESPQPAASQDPGIWGSFRALPDFQGQDDRQIAGRLYASLEREKAATKALQQYQQLIPYAQEYLTNKDAFDRWREEASRPAPQQAPQQVQQQQEVAKWWNPPQVREGYKQYLVKDENGREVIDPNAPLDARHSLYEYQKYKADFAQKFLADPQAALGPMVEQVAAERARQIVEEQLREVGEQGYVSNLERENADWLYEKDGKTPTREGLMIQHYIQHAVRFGINSPKERWEFACDMTERDLLREASEARRQAEQNRAFQAQYAMPAPAQQALPAPNIPAIAEPSEAIPQEPSAQNQAERDIEYLRREASRNPSRSSPASDPRIPQGPMTFEQRLRAQMRRDGIE